MFTNNVEDNGDTTIKMVTDTAISGNVLISDQNTIIQKSNIQLHIQDQGDVNMWLEADTDNVTEGDTPSIAFTQDGGAFGNTISGSSNNFIEISSGNSSTTTDGQFRFYSGQLDTSGSHPVIRSDILILQILDNSVDIFTNLDMNNNNISRLSDVALDSLTKEGQEI